MGIRIYIVIITVIVILTSPYSWAKDIDNRNWAEQAYMLDKMQAQQELKILALCELAAKAAPTLPKLAVLFAKQALVLESGLDKKKALNVAYSLRQNFFEQNAKKYLALANRLEKRSWQSFRFRAIGQAFTSVSPQYADFCFEMALHTCLLNPDVGQRDPELTDLAIVISRRNVWQGHLITGMIKSPAQKSKAFCLMALSSNSLGEMLCSLRYARKIKSLPEKVKALVKIAAKGHMLPQRIKDKLFEQAFQLALQIKDFKQSAQLQALCAEKRALVLPEAGLALAYMIDQTKGYCVEAYINAAKGLLPVNRGKAIQIWRLAQDQADKLTLPRQRAMAYLKIVRGVCGFDPGFARKILTNWPYGEFFIRSLAQADLALALATRNLSESQSLAETISSPAVKFRTLVRLGLLGLKKNKKSPKDLLAFGDSFLSQAKKWKEKAALQLVVPAMASLSFQKALDLIGMLQKPHQRALGYVRLAGLFWIKGDANAVLTTLKMAFWELNYRKKQQTLDNVRILGDMGRGWALVDPKGASKVFLLAANAIYDM